MIPDEAFLTVIKTLVNCPTATACCLFFDRRLSGNTTAVLSLNFPFTVA
jgi:hypothetical protein